MRVSLVQCVSTALEMLKFSTDAIFNNAGYEDFDYVVVTWLPSDAVMNYLYDLALAELRVQLISHETNPSVGYVPNLRGMMNTGFRAGFELNDYAGLVNTDMYFGPKWLEGLIRYVHPERIVSSRHFSRTKVLHHPQVDCGVTEHARFDHAAFNRAYTQWYERDGLLFEDPEVADGWRRVQTMPYLFHRQWWEDCGPWELKKGKPDTPDVRFFRRCKEAGAVFCLSESSIVYHMEAAERRGRRPIGAENMPEE